MLRKQPFDMKVTYLKGKDNAADFLSRHPIATIKTCKPAKLAEVYVNLLTSKCASSISKEELAKATNEDTTLQQVKKWLSKSKWSGGKEVMAFHPVRDELCVSKRGILLRGSRVCIPKTLQERVIDLAHEGHQGIVRTKQLLRTAVWFPGIDKMVEERLKTCFPCSLMTVNSQRDPIVMAELPKRPWEKLSMDFYTLPKGEELMVIIDDHSKFPIVEAVSSTSAGTINTRLNNILAIFGIPQEIRTDNGPPFNSEQFAVNAKQMGFHHRRITPAWPEANGEVERFMRTLKKAIATASMNGGNWKSELHHFLRNYRSTPHPATGKAPTELLFGRKIVNKLPSQPESPLADQQVHLEHKKYVENRAPYANNKRRTCPHNFQVGDVVLLKSTTRLQNKLSPKYEPQPYIIKVIKGSMVTIERVADGRTLSRNASLLKQWTGVIHSRRPKGIEQGKEEEEEDDFIVQQANQTSVEQQEQVIDEPPEQEQPRRSHRVRSRPERYGNPVYY